MIDEIVTYTNVKVGLYRNSKPQFQGTKHSYLSTSRDEVLAFFGLFYIRGVPRDNYQSLKNVFYHNSSAPHFCATMNKNRYYTLLWLTQFDNMTTREDRWVHDKLTVEREFFRKFNENCAQMMIPSELLAVEETLYHYRGGTVIKQYNPNKPAKYGLLYMSISGSKFPSHHAYGAKPNEISLCEH